MFGRRSDAKLVGKISTMRAFMPFISPRRNDSLVLIRSHVETEAAERFVAEYNETAPEDRKLTLFLLVVRAHARAFGQRSGVNRFVAGGRLWERDEVWITFSAAIEFLDSSPIVTVKRHYPADETIPEMLEGVLGRLKRRRSGEQTNTDREMHWALRIFPAWMIRIGVWLLHQANQLGLLPKKMIDDDPLFGTLFLGNLGSLGLNAGYHHLWEYGTCSAFGVMGGLQEDFRGKRFFEIAYTYDERMNDGFYAGATLNLIKEWLENPEKLV